jgi:hypothetical protein
MDFVKISSSFKYGYDKKYTNHSVRVAMLVKRVMPLARTLLDLPSSLLIELKPTRKPNAYYSHNNLKVVIDTRKCSTLVSVMRALMHELVHAEQFKHGRLKITTKTMLWEDKPVVMETKNYEKYSAQPWEKEAFRREVELTELIADMLEEKLDAGR